MSQITRHAHEEKDLVSFLFDGFAFAFMVTANHRMHVERNVKTQRCSDSSFFFSEMLSFVRTCYVASDALAEAAEFCALAARHFVVASVEVEAKWV